MAEKKLFGNKIAPACKYCEFSRAYLDISDMVLCEKRGVVSPEFHCRRYRYDPLRRKPRRPIPPPEFTAEDFTLNFEITEDLEDQSEQEETQAL